MNALVHEASARSRTKHPSEPHPRALSMVKAHVDALTDRFRILETSLRQPYARTLTDDERAALRGFLAGRIERVENLLAAAHDDAPGFSWSPGRE
jgi:hypothetical protein